VFEAVEDAFEDVHPRQAVRSWVTGRPPDEPMRLRWASWSSGLGITLPMPRFLR
jgi:hypothetical protein